MSLSEQEFSNVCASKAKKAKVKILTSDKFKEKRHMLSLFLTQMNTYIRFNWDLFKSETEKVMFAAAYLKSDTLNWFKLTLKNYLDNITKEHKDSINEIFTDYKMFKFKIKIIFQTINKEHTAERKLNLLR